MAMATKSNVLATHKTARSTARAAGVSTVLAQLHVVVGSKNVCSASPKKLAMAEPPVQERLVLRRSMHAAQNHARRIARDTGRTGVSAPTVVMAQMARNVDREANKIESSRSQWLPPQADATATTNMATWTPDPVTFLAAQKIVKVPGVTLASANKKMGAQPRLAPKRSREAMAIQKPFAVVEAPRRRASLSQRRRSVVANAAMRPMALSRVRHVVKHRAQLTARVIGGHLQIALLGAAMARPQRSTVSRNQLFMAARSAHIRMVPSMMIHAF
jgi:hypothetical protein